MKAYKVFHTNDKGELFPATPAGQAALEVGRNLKMYKVGVKYVSRNPFFCFGSNDDALEWANDDRFIRTPWAIRKVEVGGTFYETIGLGWNQDVANEIREGGKDYITHMLRHVVCFPIDVPPSYKFAATEMTILKGKR